MFESMSDLVAIWNGGLLVYLYRISKDGETPPSGADIIVGCLIQTAVEYATDYVCLVFSAGFEHVDLLAKASGRKWHWSLWTAPFVLYTSVVVGTLPLFLLCPSPSNGAVSAYCGT